MKNTALNARNKDEAWKMANEIFGTNYEKDNGASDAAGYPIYRGAAFDKWISDLGDRLELNMPKGETINIWIESVKKYTAEEVKAIIVNAKRELASIDAIRESIGKLTWTMSTSQVAAQVEILLSKKDDEYSAQLEMFGL